MKKVITALLLSMAVGFVAILVSLVPVIMVKMTGPSGGPEWFDTAFTVFLAALIVGSFLYFYTKNQR